MVGSALALLALGCSEGHGTPRSSAESEEDSAASEASSTEVISSDSAPTEDPDSCGLVKIATVPGELGGPHAMAQDDQRLYLAMPLEFNGQETETWSVSKIGGMLTRDSASSPTFPLPDEAEFAGTRYAFSAESRAITQSTGDGEAEVVTPLPAEMTEDCFAIGTDGTALYFTSEGGELWRAAVPGGSPEQLFETGRTDCDDDYNGLMVAVDQTHVYWLGGQGYSTADQVSDGEPLGLFRACK